MRIINFNLPLVVSFVAEMPSINKMNNNPKTIHIFSANLYKLLSKFHLMFLCPKSECFRYTVCKVSSTFITCCCPGENGKTPQKGALL